MGEPATLRIINDVALIQLQSPPVNTLGAALRQRLWTILNRLSNDPRIKAVVILAAGRVFSAGEDIKELGADSDAPTLGAICNLIEDFPRPVVAGLQGPALGGGAELAMAAHYRIALTTAVIGLPEVTLGLVPGAGGTQRLPRLVGPKHALNMILGGRPVSADQAFQMGLIDGVVADDLAFDAVALAQQLDHPRPTSARRDMITDGTAYLDQVKDRRKAVMATGRFASKCALGCVEAALLLPFDIGLTHETDAFERCLTHPQSRALRSIFLAERRISPDILIRTKTSWQVTQPQGQAIVDALHAAHVSVLQYLRDHGVSDGTIDRAHVSYGFARGPFGGRDGGPNALAAEIQQRVLAAFVGEGARLLEAGVVTRASDIDALAVHGLGFPRLRGGPMMAAKLGGMLALTEKMKQWSGDDRVWQPATLLLRAALLADGFDALRA